MDKETKYKIREIEKTDYDSSLVIKHINKRRIIYKIITIYEGSVALYDIGDTINAVSKGYTDKIVPYALISALMLAFTVHFGNKYINYENKLDEFVGNEYKRLYGKNI